MFQIDLFLMDNKKEFNSYSSKNDFINRNEQKSDILKYKSELNETSSNKNDKKINYKKLNYSTSDYECNACGYMNKLEINNDKNDHEDDVIDVDEEKLNKNINNNHINIIK